MKLEPVKVCKHDFPIELGECLACGPVSVALGLDSVVGFTFSRPVYLADLKPEVQSRLLDSGKWDELKAWIKVYSKSKVYDQNIPDIEGGHVALETVITKMEELERK